MQQSALRSDLVAKNWRALIHPRRLEVEEGTLSPTYGRFWCEPLERGFGQTLGNSLRRVLLSSLQGAAITTVRINGVLHEFSTVPGVLEDVSDIVLNLKEVRLRLNAEGPKVLRVHKKGEGVLTAGELAAEDASVEVLNPDHKIATLAPEADLEMEVTVASGKGYVLAEKNKTEETPIGTVPDRLDLLADPPGELHGHTGARRARDRFRSPEPRGLDRRRDRAGGRCGLRGEDHEGPAFHLHQLRGADARPRCRPTRSRRRPTRTCTSRSTSSSSRCARPTACRTRISATSASSCSAARPRC